MVRHLDVLPPAPGYGRDSIAEMFTSAAAALGVPGFANTLSLPAAKRICVVLVDGLGKALLKQRGGHAPFLRRSLENARTLSSAFPSTTAASLASFGTGLAPGAHGMVGYDVLDPAQDKVVNQLGGWDGGVDPRDWQPHPTVFEQVAAELPVITVSLPKFAESGMTQAALRGGSFVPATSGHARTLAAAQALAEHERVLVYLYFNELDKAGHRYGCASAEWGNALEELDSHLRRLAGQLPADTLLLLTADHGMLDVAPAHRYDYSLDPALVAGVRHTGGEPRMVHLYLEPDAGARHREQLAEAWQQAYGKYAWVVERDEAIAHGLFGPVQPAMLPRIGDLMIAAREPIALYDTRRVPAHALSVVGQHGSLTRAERDVPLLVLGSTVGKGGTAGAKRGRGRRG
ncbi:type I phosphodiesterase/nucleotide pyrophosphatase [Arthrobacter crystallopoietes BAB-32]|uniref:Type I phosphodiesterase/nucleotide pyrophosphatase n=1 Tax=Arthrobacter crystallopoietes BAB-32 TaxID=1246476 RepID=N1V533_9MICC|nr:nucleotide pyrophosphatase/phosphodiesterase family protein [Arthrobacter crystallopoietes]EMY33343.1 type I phosphodiesterase/nucleotide pyrophosphatase [Arthrobacter crystallopoietes BAB-32]